MPQIGQVDNLLIYAFPRSTTGAHDNNYIKIKELGKSGAVVGKWLISKNTWDGDTELTPKEKKKILNWVSNNMDIINKTIGK